MPTTEILLIILSGVLATLGMTLFLHLIRVLNFAPVSLVQLLGSFFTRTPNGRAASVGWFFHFVFGIFFAFIYVLVLKTIPGITRYSFSFVIAGSALGLVHGVVFALILLILVAEHHPILEYRKQGFGGAAFYFLAHIVYGFVIGLLYMLCASWEIF